MESAGDYLFLAGKTDNGTFRGIFRGGRDLFDPKIALRVFIAIIYHSCKTFYRKTDQIFLLIIYGTVHRSAYNAYLNSANIGAVVDILKRDCDRTVLYVIMAFY